MSQVSDSQAHFSRLAWLLEELRDSGVELREHHCEDSPQFTFTLVLSRGTRRVKFTWKATESLLEVAFAGTADDHWVHDATINLPRGAGLYEEIASETENMLAI
jgi:hypothetical protein